MSLTHEHGQSEEVSKPRLADGVELIGRYEGSGLVDDVFLVRNDDGQMLQMPKLLYSVLRSIDGERDVNQVAQATGCEIDRPVSAANIHYLLKEKLEPIGLLAAKGQVRRLNDSSGLLVLKARVTLLPEQWVNALARLLAPLFYKAVVVLVLTAFVAGDVYAIVNVSIGSAFQMALTDPTLILTAVALSFASMAFHELGHAAACLHGGARPGKIGIGLYVVWPAFYTNVTDSYRLSRSGRLRVDLGGIFFNAIFCIVLTLGYSTTGSEVLVLAMVLVHAEMLQQLLPTLRLDGYLILSDLIGIPDLFGRIGPIVRGVFRKGSTDPLVQGMRPGVRTIVSVWVLSTLVMFAAQLVFIALFGKTMATTFVDSLSFDVRLFLSDVRSVNILAIAADALSLFFLVLPFLGTCIISFALLRQVVVLMWRKRNKQNLLNSKDLHI